MNPPIATLVVRCPVHPEHGETHATPSGFRGLALACGCDLLVTPDNAGWQLKPALCPTATGRPNF